MHSYGLSHLHPFLISATILNVPRAVPHPSPHPYHHRTLSSYRSNRQSKTHIGEHPIACRKSCRAVAIGHSSGTSRPSSVMNCRNVLISTWKIRILSFINVAAFQLTRDPLDSRQIPWKSRYRLIRRDIPQRTQLLIRLGHALVREHS